MTIKDLDAIIAKDDGITNADLARILADFFKSQSKHNAEQRTGVDSQLKSLSARLERLSDLVEAAAQRSPVYQIVEEDDDIPATPDADPDTDPDETPAE